MKGKSAISRRDRAVYDTFNRFLSPIESLLGPFQDSLGAIPNQFALLLSSSYLRLVWWESHRISWKDSGGILKNIAEAICWRISKNVTSTFHWRHQIRTGLDFIDFASSLSTNHGAEIETQKHHNISDEIKRNEMLSKNNCSKKTCYEAL